MWGESVRIGVDIDGVVADTFPLILRELNQYFGKQIRSEEFKDYDVRKVYGIDEGQFKEFIRNREQLLIKEPWPVEGAAEHLKLMALRNKIYLITARREQLRGATESWLKSWGLCYEGLVLVGSHAKGDTCAALGLHIFVEDNPQNARQLAKCGIPVLLLDQPYNRGPMPPTVIRVYSWADVYQYIQTAGRVGLATNG